MSIPTYLFFYSAPPLGAMLYVHLHLYLLKLWQALADLRYCAGDRIAPYR